MDPNENLKRIRRLVTKIWNEEGDEQDAEELADLFDGLDQWLSKGGELPQAWECKV